MASDLHWLEKGEKIAIMLGLIATVAGGFLAFQSYRQAIAEKKIERTLAYIAEFDQGDMLVSQRRLAAAVRGAESPLALGQQLTLDSSENGPANDIALIIGFLAKVQICADRNLCDKAVLDDVFGPFALAMLKNLACHISEVRTRQKDDAYAASLQTVGQVSKNQFDEIVHDRCPAPVRVDP